MMRLMMMMMNRDSFQELSHLASTTGAMRIYGSGEASRFHIELRAQTAMAAHGRAERRSTASRSNCNEDLEDDADGVLFMDRPAQSRSTPSRPPPTVPSHAFYGPGVPVNETRGRDSVQEMTGPARAAKRSVRTRGSSTGAGSAHGVSGSVVLDVDDEPEAPMSGSTTRQLRPRAQPEPGSRLSFPVPRRTSTYQSLDPQPPVLMSSGGRGSPFRSRPNVDLVVPSRPAGEANAVDLDKEATVQQGRNISPPQNKGRTATQNRTSPKGAQTIGREGVLLMKPQTASVKSASSPGEVHDVDSDFFQEPSHSERVCPESRVDSLAQEVRTTAPDTRRHRKQETPRQEHVATSTLASPIQEPAASGISGVTQAADEVPSLPKFEQPLRVLFSFPPGEHRGKVQVTNDDLSRLHTGCYLNDSLIDFYVKWVEQVLAPPVAGRGENFFFSSFFFGRLRCSSPIDYAGVQRWTNDADDLFKKRFVFVPVCDSNHWSLILVANLDRIGTIIQDSDHQWVGNSVDRPSILYLDSLSSARGTEFAKVMKAYLIEEWLFRKEQECDRGREVPSERREVIKAVFAKIVRVVKPRVPVQNNEFDCGLYLLYNIVAFIRDDDGFRTKCFLSPTLFTGTSALQRAYTQGDIRVLRVEFKHIVQSLMTPEARTAVNEDERRKEQWRIAVEEMKRKNARNLSDRNVESLKSEGEYKSELVSDGLCARGEFGRLPRDGSSCHVIEPDAAPEVQREVHFEETVEDSGSIERSNSKLQSVADYPAQVREAGDVDGSVSLVLDGRSAGACEGMLPDVDDLSEPCVQQDMKTHATAEETRRILGSVDAGVDFINGNDMMATVQMTVEMPEGRESSRPHDSKLHNDQEGKHEGEYIREPSNGTVGGQGTRALREPRANLTDVVSRPEAGAGLKSESRLAIHDQPLAKRTRRMSGGSGTPHREIQTLSRDRNFMGICSDVQVMETDSSVLDVDGHVSMDRSPVVTQEAVDAENMSMMIVDSCDGRVDPAPPMDES